MAEIIVTLKSLAKKADTMFSKFTMFWRSLVWRKFHTFAEIKAKYFIT